MPAFVIVDARVFDAEQYAKAAKAAPGVVAESGGRFLGRGEDITTLEGDWEPQRMMLLEFPDLDAVRSWYDSPSYQAARELRADASKLNIVALEAPAE